MTLLLLRGWDRLAVIYHRDIPDYVERYADPRQKRNIGRQDESGYACAHGHCRPPFGARLLVLLLAHSSLATERVSCLGAHTALTASGNALRGIFEVVSSKGSARMLHSRRNARGGDEVGVSAPTMDAVRETSNAPSAVKIQPRDGARLIGRLLGRSRVVLLGREQAQQDRPSNTACSMILPTRIPMTAWLPNGRARILTFNA